MNALRRILLSAAVVVMGCGSKPAAAPPPREVAAPKPLVYQWVTEGGRAQLRPEGSSIPELEVDVGSNSALVTVEATRPFSIGPTEYKDVGSGTRLKISLVPWLGDLDLDSLRDGKRALDAWKKKTPVTPKRSLEPLDWGIPMEAWLSPDGSQRWKGTLPPVAVRPSSAFAVLKGEAPLVFLRDDAAPERPDTVFVNFEFGKPLDPLVGEGKMLRDVDWIAVSTWRPTGKVKKCGGYGRIPGVAGNTVVNVSLDEVEVRVIDRRTATVLGTRVFPPQNTCPGAVTSTQAAVGANTDVIIAWLEKQLASGKVSASK
jgi:hypothetical protein